MKVGDLVALSSYATGLGGLCRFTDSLRQRLYPDEPSLYGIVVKVGDMPTQWQRRGQNNKRYYIKWFKTHSPKGRSGSYGCDYFLRGDLKFISKKR